MDVIKDWLIRLGLGEGTAVFGVRMLAIVAMLGVACIAYIIAKRFLLRVVKNLWNEAKRFGTISCSSEKSLIGSPILHLRW